MLSGVPSMSVIWVAFTVIVQTVPNGRSTVESSGKRLAGDAINLNRVSAEPDGHCRLNELVVALTGSLKLMTMFEPTGTFVAELIGVVFWTVGPKSPGGVAPSEMVS